MEKLIQVLGLISAVALPLCNIPLMVRVIQRKSSADISLGWLFGVWACLLAVLPATLVSNDLVFRLYGVMNLALFTLVVFVVLYYRRNRGYHQKNSEVEVKQ